MNRADFKMFSEINEVPSVFAKIDRNESQFQAAIELIKKRKPTNVILVARGTSSNAGQLLKFLIEVELGLPVGIASPSTVSLYGARLNFKDTLVITLSQSGQSPDLVAVATAAKAGGALVISATNNETSPLATLAELHLDLSAGEEKAVAATKSYSAELFVGLKLITSLKSDKVVNFPELVAATKVNLQVDLSKTVAELDPANTIVVIGRGYGYCNARELALKIQETSYIPVQGITTSDFIHGPIATLTEATQIFFISPSGTPSGSLQDAAARVRGAKSKVFWIGNGNIALPSETVISGSSLSTETQSIVADSVLMQLLTLDFAIKNGTNPDSPRGLQKVTLTK
ncbi:MAG: SIS domain-containing protein [Actinomycetales bacterium]